MSIQVGVGVVCTRHIAPTGLELLLVQRGQPPGEGLWALPGGRMVFGETIQ